MIERRIGLVPVPTKTDDIVRLDDGSRVKIPGDHTIIRYILKQITKRRTRWWNPTLYYYEEINQRGQPWEGVLKFQRRENDQSGSKTPKPYQMVKF